MMLTLHALLLRCASKLCALRLGVFKRKCLFQGMLSFIGFEAYIQTVFGVEAEYSEEKTILSLIAFALIVAHTLCKNLFIQKALSEEQPPFKPKITVAVNSACSDH